MRNTVKLSRRFWNYICNNASLILSSTTNIRRLEPYVYSQLFKSVDWHCHSLYLCVINRWGGMHISWKIINMTGPTSHVRSWRKYWNGGGPDIAKFPVWDVVLSRISINWLMKHKLILFWIGNSWPKTTLTWWLMMWTQVQQILTATYSEELSSSSAIDSNDENTKPKTSNQDWYFPTCEDNHKPTPLP